MRVTNANTYRNFTSSVNNVHLTLNKSMNKITTQRAYESASDEPSLSARARCAGYPGTALRGKKDYHLCEDRNHHRNRFRDFKRRSFVQPA